ncbi:MAG: hypothetical protein FWE27_08945 [Defluviitaleaceae bacterium]|nr:hypothetical protein [Defluviitaleaceae bacterium]
MNNNYDERNKLQIIRIDARNCFVETKSDYFHMGKIHFEFATYDSNKPQGQRQTNHVHIFIDIPEFLCLTHEALSGMLHARARNQRAFNSDKKGNDRDMTPLYESLGGTSAERLAKQGRSRADGKSLSRRVKLILSNDADSYLFIADSGPGQTNKTGLIVPLKGAEPENHVSIKVNWKSINKILRMTEVHYQAWLAAKYVSESGISITLNSQKQQPKPVQETVTQNPSQKPNNNTFSKSIANINPVSADADIEEMF